MRYPRGGMETIPKTMKAVVYHGAKDLRVERLPVPRLRADELLVKVAACGVCPTDIKKIMHGTVPPPRVFGHETAGTIVQVGARARGFPVGQRVALHHHVPCMKCHACRHRAFAQCATYLKTGITAGFEPAGGGFAEYVRVMPFVFPGIVPIPKRNDFIEGAMLEPVNTVLKAVKRLNLLPGDKTLVAGQGPIGLLFTRLLDLMDVEVLATDLLLERLRWARRYGAARTLRAGDRSLPNLVDRWTKGRGLDAYILAVPVDDLIEEACQLLRGGGQVLLFAHTRRGARAPVDLSSICVDEIDLLGSYSADVTLQRKVSQLVFSRQLDVRPLVTHRLPLERTLEAVRMATNPQPETLKVVIGG